MKGEHAMTREQLALVAASILKLQSYTERVRMADEVGVVMAQLKRRFDWDKWRQACGASPGSDTY